MPALSVGDYGVALRPALLLSALVGAFPATWGSARARFNLAVLSALLASLGYTTYRFFCHFLKAWKDHDSRESSLNLTNLIIQSGVSVAALAATLTSLCRSGRVLRILHGLRTQSTALGFERTVSHGNLRRRVRNRSIVAFVFLSFIGVYEPFVWPDYFLLPDLLGRLTWSLVIAVLEAQIVSIADAFLELFATLNNLLQTARDDGLPALRQSHDELCDLIYNFQEHYGLFILTNAIYLFVSLTFGFYFSLVGIFQNLPDVEKIIKQAVISDSWLIYALYRAVQLVAKCSDSLREAKKTGVVLCRRLSPQLNCRLKNELLMFAEQIQHRGYTFRATGVLLIDYPLLFEAFSAVATYFLIMVQFQLSL